MASSSFHVTNTLKFFFFVYLHKNDVVILIFSMKLHEAVEYLNSLIEDESILEEEAAGIYIQPPDPAYDSAEDDCDDESGGCIIDLHHNQLHQYVEVEFVGKAYDDVLYECVTESVEDEPMDVCEEPESDAIVDPSTTPPMTREWKYVGTEIDLPAYQNILDWKNQIEWKEESLQSGLAIFPAANYLDCSVPAHELFERNENRD